MPTLTIAGTIAFSLGEEATPPSRPYSASLIYTEKVDNEVVITGAQADVDLMGLITDAKAAFIEMEAGEGDLKINAAVPVLALHVDGGFWVWFNPNGGLTALSITTTADAKLRAYLFS